MKTSLTVAAACLACSFASATPYPPEQLRLRAVMQPSFDLGIGANSMFNPRIFDGKVYANQINIACFARYASGSVWPEVTVNNSSGNALEHRMVAPFRGANRTNYMIGSSSAAGATTTLTRYDFDGNNPVTISSPDGQVVDAFDWVDEDTLIYAVYTSGNRKRLYLADVVAEPFAVALNTTWSANGYVTTSVSTRIRNVRKGDVYSGYAYYGDGGQANNPNIYALNLATGAETLLGNAGPVTGTGSFGLWTVVERGGYLYVQTTDDGIQVYTMTNATTLGPLYVTYTKAQLDALTGGSTQYWGLDVTPDSRKMLLAGANGMVYELGVQTQPYLAEELQLRVTIQPNLDLGISGNSMFNARFFEGKIYANQINVPCFGRYPSGSILPEMVVNNSGNTALEHRMVAPFRGANRRTYLIGSSSAIASATTLTRYDFDGNNATTIDSPDTMVVDAFDWADDDTIIYAVYTSGNRKRLCLADVVAEPFSVTKNTTWNSDGYITTSVTTRIRNVRKGDVYSGYAYYGDGGQASSPNFYAIDLATGAETLLGNAGPLTGSGSFGLWTVLERDGYLYVQTTDNGIQVYTMVNATTLGTLCASYSKEQLDAVTGGSTQYYGLDVTPDGRKLLLSGIGGKVFEIGGRPSLSISRTGTTIILSWPNDVLEQVIQSSTSLLPSAFSDISPQPSIVSDGEQNHATMPLGAGNAFFRLRKGP